MTASHPWANIQLRQRNCTIVAGLKHYVAKTIQTATSKCNYWHMHKIHMCKDRQVRSCFIWYCIISHRSQRDKSWPWQHLMWKLKCKSPCPLRQILLKVKLLHNQADINLYIAEAFQKGQNCPTDLSVLPGTICILRRTTHANHRCNWGVKCRCQTFCRKPSASSN